MDSTLTKQEQNMREEMLRHEFPFDPEAWEAMQQLLDGQRDPLPPAAPPAPTPGPRPGPGSGRIWSLLLLLAVLGAGLVTLLSAYFNRNKDVSAETETRNIRFSRENQYRGKAGASDASSPRAAANTLDYSHPHIDQSGSQTAPAERSRQPNLPVHPTAGQPTRQATYPTVKTVLPAKANLPSGEMSVRAPGSEIILPVQELDAPAIPDSRDMLSTADNRKNTQALAYAEPETARSFSTSDGAPGWLPVLPLTPLDIPLRPDSIIRTAPFAPAEAGRWERGWLFGAGLNSVDYRPLRLKAAPHFGYFLSRRITPRTALQGELALKFVAGYDWRAEFYDVVPGGSSHVILETDRLLYIELPLLLKRSRAPAHSWLLGLKPALTLPIAPYGSFSSVNSGAPVRHYSMHEGFRYLDLGLVLGWEYRLGRRWALDIRYNQGLFDLTADNFYEQRETHLNSDLQVSLRYFFTKKIRKHEPATLFPAPPVRR